MELRTIRQKLEWVVTAHLLYDVVQCEHRIALDAKHNAPINASPFIELLWRRESTHTGKVYDAMRQAHDGLTDVSGIRDYGVRANRTLNAICANTPIIIGGLLHVADIIAEPNFLVLEGDCYRVGIIKAGRGLEEDGSKMKAHYAVEIALSVDVLERLGVPVSYIGEVFDVDGEHVPYDLMASYKGDLSFWSWYEQCKRRVIGILGGEQTGPAAGSVCKECHWYENCLADLLDRDDLTLIPHIGRSRREALNGSVATRADLAACDASQYEHLVPPEYRASIRRKEFGKLIARARLAVTGGKPYLIEPLDCLRHADHELFFDVETDPTRDVCYLHGFAERWRGREGFVYEGILAETPDQEREAFVKAILYIKARPGVVIYHYSAYEKTTYRHLQRKYPDVCSLEEIDAMFEKDRAVDLYFDAVHGSSIWPTYDHSLKTLAKYVGFSWRDKHPSGAASVEWFDKWMTTGDVGHRDRILLYNEDDCVAMAWLLDAMRMFPSRPLA